MKKILLILCLVPVITMGTNYYFSSTGSDSNTGLTKTSPWKTIDKLNLAMSAMSAGDSILFKCGDTFVGTIRIGRSGTAANPIIISSYGSGSKPVISGMATLGEWSESSEGVYQSSVSCQANVNMLTIDGAPQRLGRYPNTGWLIYESFSTKVSITDNELSGTPNWTGAELVVRKNHWVIDRGPITDHVSGTLTYTSPSNYNGTANYGYFIQRDVRTLDEYGEWHYDGFNANVFFGTESPNDHVTKISILDTLVYASSKSYITFKNLAFDGANSYTFYLSGGSGITISYCTITNSGMNAVFTSNAQYLTVTNTTITNTMNNAIDMDTYGGTGTNATITYNTISKSGVLVGMDRGVGDGCNFAMSIQVPKSTIMYNTVDSVGYQGIIFVEDSTLVKYNLVKNFCLIKDDGSGIYTYQQTATPVYRGREVSNNIVITGYGNETGTADGLSQAHGIYMDGYTQNVIIKNNTVSDCHASALFLGWYTSNIQVDSNTLYNSKYQLFIERKLATAANYTFRGNKFISRNYDQNMIYYSAGSLDGTQPWILGTWSGNYYIHPTGDDAVAVADYTYSGKRYIKGYTYNMWKTFDATAKPDITDFDAYSASVGSNMFSNGNFDANVNGTSLSYAGTAAFNWDNTNKIDGGSLKLYFTALATTSNSCNVKVLTGQLDHNKNYILRVSTLAASGEHMANVHLREYVSPYTYLTSIQYIKIAEGINNAEILWKNPVADSCYIYIVVDDSTGTCYLDKIGLYEASVSDKSLDKYIFFDYATSGKISDIPLHFVDVDGNKAPASTSIPPYSSAIYFMDPNYVPTPTVKYRGQIVKYSGKVIR